MTQRRRMIVGVVVVGLALVPLGPVLDTTTRTIAIRLMIFAALGAAWNVMSGFGGLFSFGHAAYFGIGAYTTAYLLVRHGATPWLGFVLGAALAAVFGVVTSWLSLRFGLRGAYFALASFAFAETLRLMTIDIDALNRSVGFQVPLGREDSWRMLQFGPGSSGYYGLALGLVALTVVSSVVLVHSRTGSMLLAVRDDDAAAAAAGINPLRLQLHSVAVSAALSALAGGLYFVSFYFINPDLAFGSDLSIHILLPAVVGGVGTIWGPVVGSLVLTPLSELTTRLVRDPPPGLSMLEGRAGLDLVIYGALLIIIVLYLPKGVYGGIRERLGRA